MVVPQRMKRVGDGTDSGAQVRASAWRVAWCERCRRDPVLGAHDAPPLTAVLTDALASRVGRPVAPGWTVDADLEALSQRFAHRIESLEVGLAQLSCLAEVCDRSSWFGAGPRARSAVRGLVERLMIIVAHEYVVQLRDEALHDALTGLGNRRAFELGFAVERARAERHQRFVSVAMIDLDGLKRVNDAEGHAAGDARLRACAKALSGACRRSDVAYRIGGDEFVVLLPETDRAGAATFLTRLGAGAMPAFSAGAATFPSDGFQLVDVADRRLYHERAHRRPTRSTAARGL